MPKLNCVFAVNVTEIELGWGSRPDGVVFAETREAIANFSKELDEKRSGQEFSVIEGSPVVMEATEEALDLLEKAKKEGKDCVWIFREVSKYLKKI